MCMYICIEQIELQAKLLNYFLGSIKSNINQYMYTCVHICVHICIYIYVYINIYIDVLQLCILPAANKAKEAFVSVET